MSATDIVGYTYRAENFTPDNLVEELIQRRELSPAARDMTVEEALDQLAAVDGTDRQDEHSFDSDNFPKVIFESQVTEDDAEWLGWSS